jgi:hypothetical protein
LLQKAVGTFRNRAVAVTFQPWLAMWREEHKDRQEEALEAIESREDSITQQLEDHMHAVPPPPPPPRPPLTMGASLHERWVSVRVTQRPPP